MGVEAQLGAAVTAVDAEGVTLKNGRRIAARTVLWAAGVASSLQDASFDAPRDRHGRVCAAPDLSLPQHPEVFVIGDLARVEQDGELVPGVATAAKQMGNHAARAIRDRLRGHSPRAFRYRDYGTLAAIGRGAAAVDLRGLKFAGLIAWWFWLVAHIFFLIGFRNRLVVMIDWAWSYLTWQRNARIIVGRDREDRESKQSCPNAIDVDIESSPSRGGLGGDGVESFPPSPSRPPP